MPTNRETKRAREELVLTASRVAGIPIPPGGQYEDNPDFTFSARKLGVELTELMIRDEQNSGLSVARDQEDGIDIAEIARRRYYEDANAEPASVFFGLSDAEGKARDKRHAGRELAEFVKANVHRAQPTVNFDPHRTPRGFGAMSITSESREWRSFWSHSVTVEQIERLVTTAIREKSKKLPEYRRALASGAAVYLLLYSTLSRGLPIPHNIESQLFASAFDRIFWVDLSSEKFVELKNQGDMTRVCFQY